MTDHLHALHQRQTYGLVTGQADDTGRSVRRGLHQGDHCLDTQPTALKTCMHTGKINAQSPISCLQCLQFIYLLAAFTVNIWEWAEASKRACYQWGRAIITTLLKRHVLTPCVRCVSAHQYSVKCWWSSSSLDVAQYRQSGVIAQPFDHQLTTDKGISVYSVCHSAGKQWQRNEAEKMWWLIETS